MTNVEITAAEAYSITNENRGRCVTNLEDIYLEITKAANRGCDFIVVKDLQHSDYRKLITDGFKIESWYYNQRRILWNDLKD